MIENILPIRLKAIRNAAGLSQREMAERVGVSNKVLSFYEQGRNTPDAAFIARFAEVNQCSADYLLGLSDVKTQKTDVRAPNRPERKGRAENQRVLCTALSESAAGGG